MTLGSGIQGGRAVPAAINSTSIQSVSSTGRIQQRIDCKSALTLSMLLGTMNTFARTSKDEAVAISLGGSDNNANHDHSSDMRI